VSPEQSDARIELVAVHMLDEVADDSLRPTAPPPTRVRNSTRRCVSAAVGRARAGLPRLTVPIVWTLPAPPHSMVSDRSAEIAAGPEAWRRCSG